MCLENKIDRCCPMITIGEEEVGVNVEQQCRVLEFDHTQLGGIHFSFKVRVFIYLFFTNAEVLWLWMADNLRNRDTVVGDFDLEPLY